MSGGQERERRYIQVNASKSRNNSNNYKPIVIVSVNPFMHDHRPTSDPMLRAGDGEEEDFFLILLASDRLKA